MKNTNVWKLRDAEARFSEVVRRARAGAPQKITVRGKEALIVVDPERFEVRPKPRRDRAVSGARRVPTMAEFIEASKKIRGLLEGVNLDRVAMDITPRRLVFEDDDE